MTSVLVRKVTRLPETGAVHVTDWSMANATADEFDPGVLTITFEPGVLTITGNDGTVLATFPPDGWESVRVFDRNGYEIFSFRNDPAWRSHVESRRTA